MSERAGFLSAILESPADDTARAAYADWLREQPGAFDRLHGRFLWAGLTLARFRGQEVVEDGMFFDALRDQAEAAPEVIAVQLQHVLGWGWNATEWAWDNETAAPDRIHVATIPPKVANETPAERRERRRSGRARTTAAGYERGCLTWVRVRAKQWELAGEKILGSCPLQRVELLELPGLVLSIESDDGWRLRGELRPPLTQRLDRAGTAAAPIEASEPDRMEEGFARDKFVRRFAHSTWAVLTRLHFMAGFAWPGPLPESMMGPGPYVGVDPSPELLGGI
ncbi:hypothetical protein GobsT_37110 [Gemmata obscuriglobus]|uniref:TIGR02996 domain-containing protein n=1 Tax=Gemmata obscuriglobus TaxID=114 RepID=A0A2Z3GUS9_9BACT|nr:TIGR02996 domain-containing protein [Gemmata obscuriglobus]AWM38179.1 TIGR02996 domain-containing protein [Gemmata obscuriglobus]QEG28922.1 hypothetical protein GobsT_37110 [Gemmata obscuriglobus]VTS07419.1 unnamed protein product [Gemmata obscuriglobus UQM 2246]